MITPETPITADKVLKLLEPLLGRVRILRTDNVCSSPELARQLNIEHPTDCVGTVHLNRRTVLKEVTEKKLKKREIVVKYSGLDIVLK